jgi:hypothetical protein
MIRKPFKDWEAEEIENAFDITRVWQMNLLDEWIKPIEKIEKSQSIEQLKERLFKNIDIWNEDELKMFFIAPLLNQVDFYHFPYYKAFTQRPMQIKTEKVHSSGEVELVVAKGRGKPQQPFFFLHEYKPEKRKDNDPLGQLLIGMLAAKMENEESMPLYGCYVIGRLWFFVLLVDNQYVVSKAFDATDEEIYQIVGILERMKLKIEKYFKLI